MSLAKSWFDHAFRSRTDAESLLRPDLESGLISQHDFDLAVNFLPGYHRYLPVCSSVHHAQHALLMQIAMQPCDVRAHSTFTPPSGAASRA